MLHTGLHTRETYNFYNAGRMGLILRLICIIATAIAVSISSTDGTKNEEILQYFLNALNGCHHVITSPDFNDPANMGLLLSTIQRLNFAAAPFQILRTLDKFDRYRHVNRYRLACNVHFVMPQKVKKHSKVVMNHETQDTINVLLDIVVLAYDLTGGSSSFAGNYEIDSNTWCTLPINIFMIGYENTSGFTGNVIQFKRGCSGGRLACLSTLEAVRSNYRSVLLELKRSRKDFHGIRTTVEEKFRGFSHMSKRLRNSNHLRFLYKYHIVADMQPYRLLAHAHNFTFDAVPYMSQISCRTGFITSQIALHSFHNSVRGLTSHFLIALSEFDLVSNRALYTKSLDYQSPFVLPSVSSPFGIVTWLTILSLAGMATIITALKTSTIKGSITEAILLKLSPLVGQTFETRLVHKVENWFAVWLLVTFFVSAIYTNVLQSFVVVPYAKEDMTPILSLADKGYGVYGSPYLLRNLKDLEPMFAMISKETTSMKIRMDTELRSLLKRKSLQNPMEIRDFFMTKSVMLASELSSRMYIQLVPTLTWRNLHVSVEKFFYLPTWWSFAKAPNNDVLLDTFGALRQAGLVELWYKITMDRYSRAYAEPYIQEARQMKLLNEVGHDLPADTTLLSDSLVLECFAIYGYGLGVSVLTQMFLAVWQL